MPGLRQPLPQQLLPRFAPGSRCQTCPSAASLTQEKGAVPKSLVRGMGLKSKG